MNTRKAVPADRDVFFDIWLRSVRATHDFVSPEDIKLFVRLVKAYLASSEPEFWVTRDILTEPCQTESFVVLPGGTPFLKSWRRSVRLERLSVNFV